MLEEYLATGGSIFVFVVSLVFIIIYGWFGDDFLEKKIKKDQEKTERTEKKESRLEREAEKIKEEIKNEIEKTDIDHIIPNNLTKDVQSDVGRLQKDSTERIRNRLKERI